MNQDQGTATDVYHLMSPPDGPPVPTNLWLSYMSLAGSAPPLYASGKDDPDNPTWMVITVVSHGLLVVKAEGSTTVVVPGGQFGRPVTETRATTVDCRLLPVQRIRGLEVLDVGLQARPVQAGSTEWWVQWRLTIEGEDPIIFPSDRDLKDAHQSLSAERLALAVKDLVTGRRTDPPPEPS